MTLISALHIEGFRSIRNGQLRDLGDFTAFAGLNNSGKSNVLRALNAFFSGETDPGTPLQIDEDYFRADLPKKKAKRIRISLTFTLPESFKFRKGLDQVEALLGAREFNITKEWSRRALAPDYYLNDKGPLNLDDRHKVEQFLQLVNFRYVPNRVLPIEVIRGEHRALRDVLVRRLGTRAKGQEQAFSAIRDTSTSMIMALAERLRQVYPDATEVRLATPTSWNEMVFAFGYLLRQGDMELEDTLQGSGIQSLLMLETLYLIDRDYFQKFGWRQAAVWGIEEPESSLHSSLEAQIASFLRSVSTDPRSRLQILATTHSDLMLQYSDRAVLIALQDGSSRFDESDDPRMILDRSARTGVSRWVHPILHYPLDPLILVEGKCDRIFFEEALKQVRPRRAVRVRDIEQLEDQPTGGGVQNLLSYIKSNVGAIRARPSGSPVIVVLDWDAASKKPEFERRFNAGDPFEVRAWPDSYFNPSLGKTFRGVERYLSNRLIEAAEKEGSITLGRTKAQVCVVEKDEYAKLKQILCRIIERDGLRPSDLQYAEPFVREVLSAAGVAEET